jgi:hypothetical protein
MASRLDLLAGTALRQALTALRLLQSIEQLARTIQLLIEPTRSGVISAFNKVTFS